jgi:hypothetical protein
MTRLKQKRQNQYQKGDGKVIDWLKNAFNTITNPKKALTKMPKEVSDTLTKYGNETITEIIVARSKVLSIWQFLLNALTLGTFNKEKQRLKYDDIFHLYCIIVLSNGTRLITERNQRVELKEYKHLEPIDERFTIRVGGGLTLSKLFENAIAQQGDNLWYYDAVKNNCQNYITTILKSSGLYNEKFGSFINQNVDSLLTETAKKISNVTTDIASLAENIYRGGGIRRLKQQRRL